MKSCTYIINNLICQKPSMILNLSNILLKSQIQNIATFLGKSLNRSNFSIIYLIRKMSVNIISYRTSQFSLGILCFNACMMLHFLNNSCIARFILSFEVILMTFNALNKGDQTMTTLIAYSQFEF